MAERIMIANMLSTVMEHGIHTANTLEMILQWTFGIQHALHVNLLGKLARKGVVTATLASQENADGRPMNLSHVIDLLGPSWERNAKANTHVTHGYQRVC